MYLSLPPYFCRSLFCTSAVRGGVFGISAIGPVVMKFVATSGPTTRLMRSSQPETEATTRFINPVPCSYVQQNIVRPTPRLRDAKQAYSGSRRFFRSGFHRICLLTPSASTPPQKRRVFIKASTDPASSMERTDSMIFSCRLREQVASALSRNLFSMTPSSTGISRDPRKPRAVCS